MRDNLGSPALLAEQAFQQMGCARHVPVRDGQFQVCDAGVEVILEACHRGRQFAAPGLLELLGGQPSQRGTGA